MDKVLIKAVVHDAVSLDTNSAELLAADDRRMYAEIINSSDVGVWIKLGAAAVIGEGIYIGPNGFSYVINRDNLWRGAVYGIAASGTGKIVGIIDGK